MFNLYCIIFYPISPVLYYIITCCKITSTIILHACPLLFQCVQAFVNNPSEPQVSQRPPNVCVVSVEKHFAKDQINVTDCSAISSLTWVKWADEENREFVAGQLCYV